MNRILKCVLLCFFSVLFGAIDAQNKQLRAYTLEDGLPQSQVYELIQDEKGYLWLGTQGGGLSRFDGQHFKVWNKSSGLGSNYIYALFASEDSLYIGTKRGLSIKNKDHFINIEAPRIQGFFQYKNTLYLASKKGLYRLTADQNLEKVEINSELDNSSINAIIYADAHFWIATDKGLWKLTALKSAQEEKLESNNFVALVQFKTSIYAATFNDGTFIYDLKNLEEPILMREPLRINALSIQNSNELWVATDNQGISIIDTKTQTEKAALNTRNGLTVPHIRKLIADRQSNIWIATSGGGFFKYFQNSFKHYDKDTGLKGNRVYAVHHTEHDIWISNSEAGLIRVDSLGTHPIAVPEHFSGVKIKTIASDPEGNVWAGSDGRGLLFREVKIEERILVDSTNLKQIVIDTLTRKRTKNYNLNTDSGFPSDWIRKIQVDGDTIWAATYSSGIIKFNYYPEQDSLRIHEIYNKADGLEDLLIKDLRKDGKNRMWYATKNGHLGFIKDGKLKHLGPVLKQKAEFGSLLFHNNRLYIGTAGSGIWWSDAEDFGSFQKLKGEKTLYSENIYQLIFDEQGFLWAGSEKGVDRIALNEANEITDVFHFGRNDGFLGIETCLNAVDMDHKGHLWFGTIYGLTQFRPTENTLETSKPKVYFEDVKIAFKSVDSLSLSSASTTTEPLELNSKQRQLSFAYASVDLDHPNDIKYRTKLNEADWSPWSSNQEQRFSGLAYGSHIFSVQSRNYRWEQSEPIQFAFFIDSPLYKKTGFQWAVVLAVISLIALFSLWYIRRLKRDSTAEREYLKMQNHLLTLEQKALRLQMNPHFIFNVLNGIKSMATTKPEKMKLTINNFATLLRETLINSRKDYISLEDEIQTLKHYIEVEKLMATQTFSHEISVLTDLDAEEILVPPMLIQPFVENAIRHGILKGDRPGKLKIEFKTSNSFLVCRIIDNGLGIFKSQKAKTNTDHQSMALKVTQERLASISGEHGFEINEIKNDDGSIGGTSVCFKIPLETDY